MSSGGRSAREGEIYQLSVNLMKEVVCKLAYRSQEFIFPNIPLDRTRKYARIHGML